MIALAMITNLANDLFVSSLVFDQMVILKYVALLFKIL